MPEAIPVGTSKILSMMEQRGVDAHPRKPHFSLQLKMYHVSPCACDEFEIQCRLVL